MRMKIEARQSDGLMSDIDPTTHTPHPQLHSLHVLYFQQHFPPTFLNFVVLNKGKYLT
jgi:hypothetical protein